MVTITLLLLLYSLQSFSSAYDFCSSSKEEGVCGVGKRHVVCSPDSTPMTGSFVAAAPMTFKLMKDLLKEINAIRNKVASGTETNSGGQRFPKAESMREIVWNNELEYIAHHHAIRCSIKADECHSSTKFKYAGEINGVYGDTEMVGFPKTFRHVFDKIKEQRNAISEPKLISQKFTEEFGRTAPDFILLVNDQVSEAGCAVAYCRDCADDRGSQQKHCFYVTCIFNAINMKNCTVYDAAKAVPAENCGKYGGSKSEVYPNLCTGGDDQYENKCLKRAPPPTTRRPATTRKTTRAPPKPGAKPPSKPPAGAAPKPPPSGPPVDPLPPIEKDKYHYCDLPPQKLCPLDAIKEHIVCVPEQLPMNGTLIRVIRPTADDKKVSVDHHNKYRNILASGNENSANAKKKYPAAARMRELVWNDELAYIAEKHVRRCHFEHSHCHTTHEILFGGQNLGYLATKGDRTYFRLANLTIFYWYQEKDFVLNPDFTAHEFEQSIKNVGAGHFTVMANDQLSRVGCALSECHNCFNMDASAERCYHFACQYDISNVFGYGIYKKGPPTSLCKADYNLGKSKNYNNLCAATQTLLPKRFWNEKNMVGRLVSDVAAG